MESETPKPMRRARRNLLQKVGRKLEKIEQSLVYPSPSLSHRSMSSYKDYYTSYHQHALDYPDETDSNASSSSSNFRFAEKQTTDNKLPRPHSSVTLHDFDTDEKTNVNFEQYIDPMVHDINAQHYHEVQGICKELLENKFAKLYTCRDYDKKVSLLQVAVSFNTPQVIVPVLLFLENSLSKPIFYEILKQNPSAIKNYVNLTKFRLESENYISLLKQFNKNKEVAMLRFQQVNKTNDIKTKIYLLDQVAIDMHSHPWWHLQVIEYQNLLSKQRELQKTFDPTLSNSRLENQTLLETYEILYERTFRQQKNSRSADEIISQQSKDIETKFRMSSELVMCARLAVIMRCGLHKHYEDFIHQAMHKGVFGKKYIIPPESLADMVYKWVTVSGENTEKASQKTEVFLNMIQNPHRRIYYAEKFQNYDVALNTIVNIRDRSLLENLRRRIPYGHPAFNRATSLLENTKWRN